MGRISKGYVILSFCDMPIAGHHLAWVMHFDEIPVRHIDHINGVRSDNRIANLRLADRTQNACNKPTPESNTSGFKGVTLNRKRGVWTAQIGFRGKHIFLGDFVSFDDAVSARVQAELYYFGNFSQIDQSLKDTRWSPECAVPKVRSDNTSGVTGVVWDEKKKKWAARISIHGVMKNIGRFGDFDDAVAARQAAEKHEGFSPTMRASLPTHFTN